MDSKRIGLQIKYYRQSAGLTQKELADKIGTSWEMVSRYETGKSSASRKFSNIADALNVPLSVLLSPNTLEDTGPQYQRNTIPLINQPFSNLSTTIQTTKNFYVAPDWIVQKCTRPLAFETEILTIETTRINGAGIIFTSSEKPAQPNDLIVTYDKQHIYVSPSDTRSTLRKFIGTVVAWEQRFR